MAYIVMACIAKALIVIANIVMAYIAMAYVVMAYECLSCGTVVFAVGLVDRLLAHGHVCIDRSTDRNYRPS